MEIVGNILSTLLGIILSMRKEWRILLASSLPEGRVQLRLGHLSKAQPEILKEGVVWNQKMVKSRDCCLK